MEVEENRSVGGCEGVNVKKSEEASLVEMEPQVCPTLHPVVPKTIGRCVGRCGRVRLVVYSDA